MCDIFTGIDQIITSITELVALEGHVLQEIQSFVSKYKDMIPPEIQHQIRPEIVSGFLRWRIHLVKTLSKNPIRSPNILLWNLYFFKLNGHYKVLKDLVKKQALLNRMKKDITSAFAYIQNRYTKLLTGKPLGLSPAQYPHRFALRELTPKNIEGILLPIEFILLDEGISIESRYRLSAPRELFTILKLLLRLGESSLLPVFYLRWYLCLGSRSFWIKKFNFSRLPKKLVAYKDFLTPFVRSAKDYNKKRYSIYCLLKSIYHTATRIIKTYRTCIPFSQTEESQNK